MKILSIDTASNLCTVAILENKECIKEIIVDDARNHSEKIMPVIEQALNEANLNLKNIDLMVCDKGPGSFTGIRIGVGTVLAFQDSLSIPCVGISSLEALAYNVKTDGLICSLIDAKNDNVYFGMFNKKGNIYIKIEDFKFNTIKEVMQNLEKYSYQITFVGDGSIVHKNLILNTFTNSNFCDKNDLSSYSLGLAGLDSYSNNTNTNLMPLYLRKSQAERALEEKSN